MSTSKRSSSINHLRYRQGLSFKYLTSIDLCLSLPVNPPCFRLGVAGQTAKAAAEKEVGSHEWKLAY